MKLTISAALAASALGPIEARALLRHLLKVSDAYLIAHGDEQMSAADAAALREHAARRLAGEPIAYIVGSREFYGLEFRVTPAVLIPRPETELLVDFALERIAPQTSARVLELGTGSGCIAISVAYHRPHARVTAIDLSTDALALAGENARCHALANLELLAGDWFSGLTGTYDLIVSNPPYVNAGDAHLTSGDLRFEPRSALVGGADGLACIREIVACAPRYLARGGWIALEHGYDQAARCRELLSGAGLAEPFTQRDLAGIERMSGARKPWV